MTYAWQNWDWNLYVFLLRLYWIPFFFLCAVTVAILASILAMCMKSGVCIRLWISCGRETDKPAYLNPGLTFFGTLSQSLPVLPECQIMGLTWNDFSKIKHMTYMYNITPRIKGNKVNGGLSGTQRSCDQMENVRVSLGDCISDGNLTCIW